MFRRQLVLAAIDHATDIGRTMDVALTVARGRSADIDVIRVVPHKAVPIDERPKADALDARDGRNTDLDAQLASSRQTAEQHGVRLRTVTLHGEPAQVVPAYAQLHDASLLILERDYGSSRFWRSSRVVDDVARRSPIPLLVLPRRQRRERDVPSARRVVTAVDFSVASAVALRTAADLSRRYGARLTVVHALADVPQYLAFGGGEAFEVVRQRPEHVKAVAERLRHRAASVGANDVDAEVATGTAEGAILETAARTGADLVVMGIAHRSWLDRVLGGSTMRRVLRRATMPVLVVPVVAGGHVWPSPALTGAGRGDMAAGGLRRAAA